MFNHQWYSLLNKPTLTPPAWVFPPAWTFLYITILVALILYGRACKKQKLFGYIIFFTQLGLNLLWSPIFFGIKKIGLALIIIILLDILVVINIIEFFKISKPSAFWLIPYFVWIIFATYLNIGFFILN